MRSFWMLVVVGVLGACAPVPEPVSPPDAAVEPDAFVSPYTIAGGWTIVIECREPSTIQVQIDDDGTELAVHVTHDGVDVGRCILDLEDGIYYQARVRCLDLNLRFSLEDSGLGEPKCYQAGPTPADTDIALPGCQSLASAGSTVTARDR